MRPTISPDQTLATPGKAEADEIRADYDGAIDGLKRFVSMGLKLAQVKARLPHGQYMGWIEKNLPDLCHRHLHRAKSIALGLCDLSGVKLDSRVQFEDLPREAQDLVSGSTGYRSLLAEVQEYRSDQDEETAHAKCEAMFRNDPELRDEWEPRALSGEMSWTLVLRGIAGQTATKGGRRSEPDYSILVPRSLTTIRNGFAKWDSLPPEAKATATVEFRKLFASMPEDLRRAIS